jgi:hypothetical protein
MRPPNPGTQIDLSVIRNAAPTEAAAGDPQTEERADQAGIGHPKTSRHRGELAR